MTNKTCKNCENTYIISVFGYDINKPDGRRQYCPDCIKERNKLYYMKTKEKRREQYKEKKEKEIKI